jgi:hypothetical protein
MICHQTTVSCVAGTNNIKLSNTSPITNPDYLRLLDVQLYEPGAALKYKTSYMQAYMMSGGGSDAARLFAGWSENGQICWNGNLPWHAPYNISIDVYSCRVGQEIRIAWAACKHGEV